MKMTKPRFLLFREGNCSYEGETIMGHGFCLVSFHLVVVIYGRHKNKTDGELL